jgi:DNA-directed RNA polymerase subunit RPC12/RpoP
MAETTGQTLAQRRGLDLREAWDKAFGGPGAAVAGRFEQTMERAVSTMLDRMVQDLQRGATAPPEGGVNLDRVLQAALVSKLLRDVVADPTPSPKAQEPLAEVLTVMLKTTSETQRAVVEMMAKIQEGNLQFRQDLSQFLMQFLDKIREERQQNPWDEIARQKLLESLNSNPVESYLQMENMIRQKLERESQRTNVIEFDKWVKAKEIELKEKEIDKRFEAEAQRQERFAQLMGDLAAAVSGQPPVSAVGAGAPAAAPGGVPAGLVRVHCAQCGKVFGLPEPPQVGQTLRCPFPDCGAEIMVQATHGGAPTPGPGVPPATPAYHPAADLLSGEL